MVGDEDANQKVEAISEEIKNTHGIIPRLEDRDEYIVHESAHLRGHYADRNIIEKAQAFAREKADKEIERRTYQAMEALVHNLNTMHSRAGAQIPFSSLNYGTDTSPEGRLVTKNLLLATEAGLGNGETPIFPIQIFKIKEGVNYNPEDPNYDLFKLACRVSAQIISNSLL